LSVVSSAVRSTPAATSLPTTLVCSACGFSAAASELPLRCPRAVAGDDIDHLITRRLDTSGLTWPAGSEANPFVRYRTLFHAYHVARARGWSDAEVIAEIERLDAAVASVDGHGFRTTPLRALRGLAGTLVKDETGNVAGSHKARHLFGVLLSLRLAGADDPSRPLAIASCGNAALAAATVARAAGRELHVFVPTDADEVVIERLSHLGALITVCERRPAEHGDPTVLRLREALAAGALPFTCQGSENGLAIEGGLTLGYELADQLRAGAQQLDHLFVQVGGGALASAMIQALQEARALGALERMPRVWAVQTANTHPLARAYNVLAGRIADGSSIDAALAWAGHHRSACMWPWTPTPHSVAGGILDDETYDWRAVVAGLLTSGGRPVLVGENELLEANHYARAQSGIEVDVTGSAGLAGLLAVRRSGEIQATETGVVLFTGVRRAGGPS
jgi:threonine synthase